VPEGGRFIAGSDEFGPHPDLDRFIYDPNRSAGQVILNATKGSLRFSTGSQNHGTISVKTPYGTLGIRG